MKITLDAHIPGRKASFGGAEGRIPCERRGRDVDADECVACSAPCGNGFHITGRVGEDIESTVVVRRALLGLL